MTVSQPLRVRAAMPGDQTSTPRPRGWPIPVLGLALMMVTLAVSTIHDGATPNGYRAVHWQGPWVYPTEAIVTWLGVRVVEGVIAILVLMARWSLSLGARCVLLSGLTFLVLIAMAPLAMHAGTPIIEHLMWLFFASIWLLVSAIGLGIAHLARRDQPTATDLALLAKHDQPPSD